VIFDNPSNFLPAMNKLIFSFKSKLSVKEYVFLISYVLIILANLDFISDILLSFIWYTKSVISDNN
jgi:hypothetical protein